MSLYLAVVESEKCGNCKKLSWGVLDDHEQVYGYAKQLLVIPYGERGWVLNTSLAVVLCFNLASNKNSNILITSE